MDKGPAHGEGRVLASVVNSTDIDDRDTVRCHRWRVSIDISCRNFALLPSNNCVSLNLEGSKVPQEIHIHRLHLDHHFQTRR